LDQDSYVAPQPSTSQADIGPLTKELSVLDGLYVLAKRSRMIVLLTLIGIGLGVVVAITTPAEYTSSAVLMRETQRESSGGSLAALRGLGLNLGESQSGLTIAAYPNVLESHEVHSILLEEAFSLASGERVTFLAYVQNKVPSSLSGRLRRMFRSDREQCGAERANPVVDTLSVAYTCEQQKAMESMSEMIRVDADAETGLMTLSVIAQDPVLAASLAGRLVEELQTRVQSLLTQKAREDHEFIRERTVGAEADLRSARALLARFEDRNRGLTSAQLLAERDRLRDEVNFATDVFSQYQSELKQAEIEVQRASPVITVLDRPVVPLLPTRPRRKVIVLIGALFGLAMSLILAFVMEGFNVEAGTEDGRHKRAAIRTALIPRRLRRGKRHSIDDSSTHDEDEDESVLRTEP